MPWADFVGNDRALTLLRRAIAEERLHHALLFHGMAGVGKSLAASLLAQSLLCPDAAGGNFGTGGTSGVDGAAEAGGGDPCGTCSTCRRIETGTHPDVSRVTLTISKSTGRLRQEVVIDQIRELSHHLAFRPMEGHRRVGIVDPADRLNAAAANAFLKTLEEPPPTSQIVLVATNAFTLLPTIRSRCSPLPFVPAARPLIEERLVADGASKKDATLAAAISEGAYGRARALLEPDESAARGENTPRRLDVYRERRNRILVSLVDVVTGRGGPGTRVIRAADSFSPKDAREFELCVDQTQALLRDAMIVASGGSGGSTAVGTDEGAEGIARLAKGLGGKLASVAVGATDTLRAELRVNVNRTLAVEFLLAGLAR